MGLRCGGIPFYASLSREGVLTIYSCNYDNVYKEYNCDDNDGNRKHNSRYYVAKITQFTDLNTNIQVDRMWHMKRMWAFMMKNDSTGKLQVPKGGKCG